MTDTDSAETFSAVIDKTFEDTLDLLVEARNYAAFSPSARDDRRTPLEGLAVAGSHLRVTSRLAGVMAWLLYQKAVAAGEIDAAEILRTLPRLDGVDPCLDDRNDRHLALPSGLQGLLARSHRLYLRVARLDAMIREAHAGRGEG